MLKSKTFISKSKQPLTESYTKIVPGVKPFFKNSGFVFLLPLFFVLHGYVQFYQVLFLKNVLTLLVEYLVATCLLLGLAFLLFRCWYKSALAVFALLSYQLFFGAVKDAAEAVFGNAFFLRHSFLLSASLFMFAFLFYRLKKTTHTFSRIRTYLSILLLLLLCVEFCRLVFFSFAQNRYEATATANISLSDSVQKPDIYLLLADGYAGKTELTQALQFDNTVFENALRSLGFYLVQNTQSNYNSTPYSMASLLNMDYLHGIRANHENAADIALCYRKINHNVLVNALKQAGYSFQNYSIFNVDDQETASNGFTLFGTKTKMISNQTFLSRLEADLGYTIYSKLHFYSAIRKRWTTVLHDNEKAMRQLREEVREEIATPRFVYAHFMMPHYPYYYNKDGKTNDLEKMVDVKNCTDADYLSYLQYCNGQFLSLLDDVLLKTERKAIVIFMSDHGYRDFKKPMDVQFQFSNINAVYLPNKNYGSFYNGLSNVNQFRVLLNTQFGLHLPLLKDSIIAVK